jgi:hypothetical protein
MERKRGKNGDNIMSGILQGKATRLTLIYYAIIIYYSVTVYRNIINDPAQAGLMNDATGTALNILLIGIALQFAFLGVYKFMRSKAGKVL